MSASAVQSAPRLRHPLKQHQVGAIPANFMHQAPGTRQFAASASLGVPQSIPAATQSSSRLSTSHSQPPRTQTNRSWEVQAGGALRERKTPLNPTVSQSQHAGELVQWQGPAHQKPLQDIGILGKTSTCHQMTHERKDVTVAPPMSRNETASNASALSTSAGKLTKLHDTHATRNSRAPKHENEDNALSRSPRTFSPAPQCHR